MNVNKEILKDAYTWLIIITLILDCKECMKFVTPHLNNNFNLNEMPHR